MNAKEHVQSAREFLEASDREFETGDKLQASEKLWGAASYALMAVIQENGQIAWNHRELRQAASRLADEREDKAITVGFRSAEMFHANFYHGYLEDFQISGGREEVRLFVHLLLPSHTQGPALYQQD